MTNPPTVDNKGCTAVRFESGTRCTLPHGHTAAHVWGTPPDPPTVDIEAGERLLAEATPGPWYVRKGRWVSSDRDEGFGVQTFDVAGAWQGSDYAMDDAALIVYAVNHLPALLATAREAEEYAGLRESARDLRNSNEWIGNVFRASLHATQESPGAASDSSGPGLSSPALHHPEPEEER